MKTLSWILAGIGIGVAITYLVNNQSTSAYVTGSDDVEDAAGKTFNWGSKQRVTGTGSSVLGKVKEGVGNLTGKDDLAAEGLVDQATGSIKDAAGQVAHAAGQTIHDLNK